MRILRSIRLIIAILAVAATITPDLVAQNIQDPVRQNPNGKNLVREWVRSQRTALEQVKAFSVSETVHSTVDAGAGQRNFRLVARRTAERQQEGGLNDTTRQAGRFQMEREILQLVANGQEISGERASRFLMQQRRMMQPKFAGLIDSFRFPIQEVARWESVEPLQLIERGGTHYWKLIGLTTIRPPFGRPPERGRGPEVDVRPPPPSARKSRISAWFTTDTFRLHATLIEFPLPGRFSLTVQTTYSNEGLLDVPLKRVVEGTIPIRRRTRVFAVQFKQTIDYTDYDISRN